MNIIHFLLVGAGGCIGSMARHLTVISVDRKLNSIFPFGTFTVNVVGSFILGFILAWVAKKTGTHNEAWKVFLGTGFCGGFTTFSAFAAENLNLFEQKLPATALIYICLSVIAGLLSVWAGLVLGRNIL
ncbi:MAG TPA: fluoride efflux transporter CrcB [Chryseosolibacter sp.]